MVFGFEFFPGPMHLGLRTGPLCPHVLYYEACPESKDNKGLNLLKPEFYI